MNVAPYHTPCIEIEGKTKTLYWMGANKSDLQERSFPDSCQNCFSSVQIYFQTNAQFCSLGVFTSKKGDFFLDRFCAPHLAQIYRVIIVAFKLSILKRLCMKSLIHHEIMFWNTWQSHPWKYFIKNRATTFQTNTLTQMKWCTMLIAFIIIWKSIHGKRHWSGQ